MKTDKWQPRHERLVNLSFDGFRALALDPMANRREDLLIKKP